MTTLVLATPLSVSFSLTSNATFEFEIYTSFVCNVTSVPRIYWGKAGDNALRISVGERERLKGKYGNWTVRSN